MKKMLFAICALGLSGCGGSGSDGRKTTPSRGVKPPDPVPESAPDAAARAAPAPSDRKPVQPRPAGLPALSNKQVALMGCNQLFHAYRRYQQGAETCKKSKDCTALQHTSLICPGCRRYFNPSVPAYGVMVRLAQAFRKRKCPIAPCTPPLCRHVSVQCKGGRCVTRQR